MPQTKSNRKEVVAALLWKEGRFLICQRPIGKARAGQWEIVGGKEEEGESLEEALVRECREEIGVTVVVDEPYMAVEYDYPDIPVHLTLFQAHLAEGEPRSMEQNPLAWITPEELSNYSFCPADIPIVARMKNDFCKN